MFLVLCRQFLHDADSYGDTADQDHHTQCDVGDI
jgi:hypothetical protein